MQYPSGFCAAVASFVPPKPTPALCIYAAPQPLQRLLPPHHVRPLLCGQLRAPASRRRRQRWPLHLLTTPPPPPPPPTPPPPQRERERGTGGPCREWQRHWAAVAAAAASAAAAQEEEEQVPVAGGGPGGCACLWVGAGGGWACMGCPPVPMRWLAWRFHGVVGGRRPHSRKCRRTSAVRRGAVHFFGGHTVMGQWRYWGLRIGWKAVRAAALPLPVVLLVA